MIDGVWRRIAPLYRTEFSAIASLLGHASNSSSSTASYITDMTTVLNLDPITTLTREQFFQLCQANPDLPLERSSTGELIIVTPIGGEGGKREANLIIQVGIWNQQTQLGVVFSSQTVFSLPAGGELA
ncbi:hypothetical protein MC7420_5505 [Coleofasciculus chthonoplastes PCC 7420]|uniref:Putative restriction endonuclease domain-containing protein n=1 Tax=Coleofasciculus chthonoplastes PCC 7420 TaxID=118168 RepID=B4VPP5_9CYAN|nr:hypothetical protein MC7420_5505 [Coleofasciculus chthonoplastes PCC 7420]